MAGTKIWFQDNRLQTRRPTLVRSRPELGSSAERGRSAAQRQIFNGRAKNGYFHAGSCFNPGCRHDNRNVTRCRFDFSMNKGDNRAVIVVVGNRSAVQPCVQGCPRLGGGHEQPHRQRQNCRCSVKTLPPPAINSTLLVLQTVCNIAKDMPPARLIFEGRPPNRDLPPGSKRRERSLGRATTCQSNTPPQFPIKKARSHWLRAFESNPV